MFFAIFFVHDKKIYPKRLFIGTPCLVPTYTNLFVRSNDFLDKPCFSLHSRQPCSKRLFIGTPCLVPTYTNLFVRSNDSLDKPYFSLHSRQPCSKRLFIGTPRLANLFYACAYSAPHSTREEFDKSLVPLHTNLFVSACGIRDFLFRRILTSNFHSQAPLFRHEFPFLPFPRQFAGAADPSS